MIITVHVQAFSSHCNIGSFEVEGYYSTWLLQHSCLIKLSAFLLRHKCICSLQSRTNISLVIRFLHLYVSGLIFILWKKAKQKTERWNARIISLFNMKKQIRNTIDCVIDHSISESIFRTVQNSSQGNPWKWILNTENIYQLKGNSIFLHSALLNI